MKEIISIKGMHQFSEFTYLDIKKLKNLQKQL